MLIKDARKSLEFVGTEDNIDFYVVKVKVGNFVKFDFILIDNVLYEPVATFVFTEGFIINLKILANSRSDISNVLKVIDKEEEYIRGIYENYLQSENCF